MSDSKTAEIPLTANAESEAQVVETKSPTKRTPKRKADAFQKESEELLKNLGVAVDMDDGRRRTRSSARGATATPITTPATPPAKRARGSSSTPRRGGKLENEDPEEGTPDGKVTPKKGVLGGPKKLADLMQVDQKQDEESGAKNIDTEKKGTNEVKKDATSPAVADDKSADPPKQAKDSEKDGADKDEADSGKDLVEIKQPGKSDDCRAVEKLADRKHSVEVVAKEEPKAAEEEKAAVVGSKLMNKPAEEPMEIDDQDTNSSTATKTTIQDVAAKVTAEAKPTTDAIQQMPKEVEDVKEANAETAESNGTNVSAAVVAQQKTPEKAVCAVKETNAVNVAAKKETSIAAEENTSQSKDTVKSVESQTSEGDKTAPTVTVSKIDSTTPTDNNVTDKVSVNVESKIVANESTAVEPATAP